jgi:hypothetical protein
MDLATKNMELLWNSLEIASKIDHCLTSTGQQFAGKSPFSFRSIIELSGSCSIANCQITIVGIWWYVDFVSRMGTGICIYDVLTNLWWLSWFLNAYATSMVCSRYIELDHGGLSTQKKSIIMYYPFIWVCNPQK